MRAGQIVSDRFELDSLVSSGGMGRIYRARDLRTGEAVALKVLHSVGAEDLERFARESQVLSMLHHPGIVRYVAGGIVREEHEPYLAMEWLEGESLADRLKRQPLTLAESVTLAVRVASALAAVHRHGIVHRDIKPSNLFLRGGQVDTVALIDFGIARQSSEVRQLTATGMILGTPGYIAPEQARGDPSIDARADIFSLGCVMYRCLSGREPFSGSDLLSVLFKVTMDEPPRPYELHRSIPRPLDSLVSRMLSKSRNDRPHDGSAVVAELAAIADVVAMDKGAPSSRAPTSLPPEITATERRVTCLVLARPGRGPAADVEARQRAYHALGERHGARVEVLPDGSAVLLLSSAGAATDLVMRAARCALAISAIQEGSAAIVCGRQVVSPSAPAGELIERAVQLVAVDPGKPGIRVDEVTASLLGGRFDVEQSGGCVYLRAERSEPDVQRALLGKPTTCVGRERELADLEARFVQCDEDGTATAVLVTAGAGVGKSRLMHELLQRLRSRDRRLEIWFGRGDSVGAGSAYGLVAQVLRGACALLEGEPLEARRHKLSARVSRTSLSGDGDPTGVIEFLGELTGTPFDDTDSVQLRAARQDPALRAEQVRRAWLRFLRGECSAHPVLIVLEDLQWGDLPSVRLIDAALKELPEQPLMVLALGRPEVHEIFPGLWSERSFQEIRLQPLSRRASEALVRQVLGDRLDDEALKLLVARAQGHAFFLEELIRAAADGDGRALPETVLAMVQARFDRLDPEARRVLRAASVFGETFWVGGIERLLPNVSPTDWLHELAEQKLIVQSESGRFLSEAEYRFRHALLREAAYGMLTEEDRTVGHRLAAEWLERAGETDAMIMAEHFERGGALERAAEWFQRAAEHALEGGDIGAAHALVDRGLRATTAGELRGTLLVTKGQVLTFRGQHDEASRYYREALPLLARSSTPWYHAIGGDVIACAFVGNLDRVTLYLSALRNSPVDGQITSQLVHALCTAMLILCMAGHHDGAAEILSRVDAMVSGGSPGVTGVAAWVDIAHCHYACFVEDDPWSLRGHARSALAHGSRTGNRRVIHLAQAYEGLSLVRLGDFDAGQRRLLEARAGGVKLQYPLVSDLASLLLADALLSRGEAARAEALRAEAQECASGLFRSAWIIVAASAALRGGDAAGAATYARAAVRSLDHVSPGYCARALSQLAIVEIARGNQAAAAEAARGALRRLDALGRCYGEVAIRLACAETLSEAGEAAAAAQVIAASRRRILAISEAITEPQVRSSFLADVKENTRVLELAARWGV